MSRAGRRGITRRELLQGAAALAIGHAVAPGGVRAGTSEEFDLCVIGSGFAGTTIGLQVAQAGFRTVIVEAGGSTSSGAGSRGLADSFHYTNSGGIQYPLAGTRVIGVGGTSAHWTGNVNRLRPSDFRVHTMFGTNVDWPISYQDLAAYYCRAEVALATQGHAPVEAEPPRTCAYPKPLPGSYAAPEVRFDERALTFCPIAKSRRNDGPVRLTDSEIPRFTALAHTELLAGRRVRRIVTDDGANIQHIEVDLADGRRETIRARCFVVAAGVIESPRLLLLSRSRWFPNGLGNRGGLLGRNLIAHPTWIFKYQPKDRAGLTDGVHRSYDYNDLARSESLDAGHYQLTVRGLHHAVMKYQPEMESRLENRVRLSSTRLDPHGDPLPDLVLSYSARDDKSYEKGIARLRGYLAGAAIDSEEIAPAHKWRAHPAGTCRMGFDETSGVVDRDGRVFGLSNLYVSGACTFPTSGTSNPTLTVVALAIKLGDHLVRRLSS